MFTTAAFHELKPDLLIQLIPLGHPPPRNSTVLHRIEKLLEEDYPHILVDHEHGTIAINTRKYVNALKE